MRKFPPPQSVQALDQQALPGNCLPNALDLSLLTWCSMLIVAIAVRSVIRNLAPRLGSGKGGIIDLAECPRHSTQLGWCQLWMGLLPDSKGSARLAAASLPICVTSMHRIAKAVANRPPKMAKDITANSPSSIHFCAAGHAYCCRRPPQYRGRHLVLASSRRPVARPSPSQSCCGDEQELGSGDMFSPVGHSVRCWLPSRGHPLSQAERGGIESRRWQTPHRGQSFSPPTGTTNGWCFFRRVRHDPHAGVENFTCHDQLCRPAKQAGEHAVISLVIDGIESGAQTGRGFPGRSVNGVFQCGGSRPSGRRFAENQGKPCVHGRHQPVQGRQVDLPATRFHAECGRSRP